MKKTESLVDLLREAGVLSDEEKYDTLTNSKGFNAIDNYSLVRKTHNFIEPDLFKEQYAVANSKVSLT